MYRPKFCAECGERVERARWRVWTSGRFCPACEKHYGRRRFVAMLAACISVAALSFVLGRAGRPAPPPLTIVRGGLPAIDRTTAQVGGNSGGNAEASDVAKPTALSHDPSGTVTEQPTDPLEIVSTCGARTKKGTPCSRRVRGTGRCWQHVGRPAMIPLEKRVYRESP